MYDYDNCKESELVRRAKKQDLKAFAKLYEAVYIDLYRFALCTMRHQQDAEDAVSETIIAAYENLAKLKKEEAFRSWLFKVLVNICKKKWAKEKNREPFSEREEPAEEIDLALREDIKIAFSSVSEEEQLIVAMSVFGGYNSTEIGETLVMNASTVRSKRKRALEKMGSILS